MIGTSMVEAFSFLLEKIHLPRNSRQHPFKNFEGISVELNLRKEKKLCCSYNMYKINISNHRHILGETLNKQIAMYENFLVVGNFSSEITESAMEAFCEMYHLRNVIKDSTFFKNPDKPSYSDLILANFSKPFVKSQTLETCLLYFQKLTLIFPQIHYEKEKPVIVMGL